MKDILLKFFFSLGIGLALSHFGIASDQLEKKIDSLLKKDLSKKFNGASIEFLPGSSFPVPQDGRTVSRVQLISESGTGTADYSVTYSDGQTSIGQVRFAAMVPTYVAVRRIRPGEKLTRGDFQVQPVNIAQGLAYQYRGVMLSSKQPVDGLQARQTILEGQYPLMSGVEKVPDIRRGDAVEVKILSGEIQLSTRATVQEPGFLGEKVRILTQKSKKELVGLLKERGVVEVKL